MQIQRAPLQHSSPSSIQLGKKCLKKLTPPGIG